MPCATRRRAFLLNRRSCPLRHQEDMSSCSARSQEEEEDMSLRRQEEICRLVAQVAREDASSLSTGGHVLLLHRKACLPVAHEDMSSCSTSRHVFLFNDKGHGFLLNMRTRLLDKRTCLLAGQEEMSSCPANNHVGPGPRVCFGWILVT